jgi:hypothetical protein
MAISLKLDEMTSEEKIAVMEALWRDLSREDYASPLWHREVLEAREGAASIGWDEAKRRIRDRACK